MNLEPKNSFEFLVMRSLFRIPILAQVMIITLLYVLTIYGYYISVTLNGKMSGYSPSVSILFVPIYEEIIFRGFLLKFFENHFGFWKAIFGSSILFSLWHLKNIFWIDHSVLIEQMLYTGLFFGPMTAWLTLKTRSLWPAVTIHYLNNMPYEYIFKGLF